ncbi:MAG: RodZ domain-containing protein [Novosphingobium sp.]
MVELPLDGVGTTLLRAREAAGLKLSDIAARTRIAERHLLLIEQGKFSAMASRAYAVGFARSYARTLGLDERAIADAVRAELAGQEPSSDRYQPSSFEPGDPARVPSGKIAWIAGLGALAVVLIGFMLWRSFYAPAQSIPEPQASETSAAPIAVASVATEAAQGPVVFTALKPGIWVKFYDAAGVQLFQKELAQGETYTVPAEASGPMIRTARPDALQITVGGRDVPKLSERDETITDVPVSAAALLARSSSAPPAPPAVATPAPVASSAVSTPKRPLARNNSADQRIPASRQTSAARQSQSAPSTGSGATSATASPSPAQPVASQSSTVSQ